MINFVKDLLSSAVKDELKEELKEELGSKLGEVGKICKQTMTAASEVIKGPQIETFGIPTNFYSQIEFDRYQNLFAVSQNDGLIKVYFCNKK